MQAVTAFVITQPTQPLFPAHEMRAGATVEPGGFGGTEPLPLEWYYPTKPVPLQFSEHILLPWLTLPEDPPNCKLNLCPCAADFMSTVSATTISHFLHSRGLNSLQFSQVSRFYVKNQ